MYGSEILLHEDAQRLGKILLILKLEWTVLFSTPQPGTNSNADGNEFNWTTGRRNSTTERRGTPPANAMSSLLREQKHSLVQSCSQDVFAIWRELHEGHWRIVIIYTEEKQVGPWQSQDASQLPVTMLTVRPLPPAL